MTLISTPPIKDYVEDGSTLAHAIPFQFQIPSEILCTRIPSGGVEGPPLIEGADYVVTGGAGAAGTVTKTSAGTAGTVFRIRRRTDQSQSTRYLNSGTFPADAVELSLDREMAVAQEGDTRIALLERRALQVATSDIIPPLGGATVRASKFMQWASDGKSLLLVSASSVAAAIAASLAGLLPSVVKGDPGGNVMAIGLFVFASTLSIANGTDIVRTAGYSTTGIGAADYVADAAVDAAYVAANPRFAFISANGRGFRLREKGTRISPFMVGAAGDAVTDDRIPLQALSDWYFQDGVHYRDCSLDMDGNFAWAGQLLFGPPAWIDESNARRNPISGEFRGTQLTSGTFETLRVRNLRRTVWHGRISVVGHGGATFASRTDANGIYFQNCYGMILTGGVRAQNFWQWGVWCPTVGSDFSDCMRFSHVTCFDCGSGVSGYSLTGNWSAAVNSGSSGSGSQRTQLTVDTLPNAALETYIAAGLTQIQARINGYLYYIYGIDRGAGTISIYPWIDPAAGASGTLEWVFGGGLGLQGGDAGIVQVGQLFTTRCSRGLGAGSLYGPRIESAVIQSCGSAVLIGNSPESASLGTSIDALYTEGNNEEICVLTRFGNASRHYICSTHTLVLAKCWGLGDPRLTGGVLGGLEGGALGSYDNGPGVVLAVAGDLCTHHARPLPAGVQPAQFRDHRRRPLIRTRRVDGETVTLQQIDVAYNRLFGTNGARWCYVGSGAGGAPTGTITFDPPPGGTVNGGAVDATVSFSGFDGPVDFEIYHTDTAQLTWIVQQVTKSRVSTQALGYSASGRVPPVTQTGSKTTTVTMNGYNGTIITTADSIPAGQTTSFKVANNKVASNDGIILSQQLGQAYYSLSSRLDGGGFWIDIHNTDIVNAHGDILTINAMVFKG